jgi:ATP-dependent RNA helicase DDX49/DBP8
MSDGFDKLGIEKWLCRRIASVGFGKPTQVQRSCIPPILEGRDCISCAKKDSGKNATIALPIIQRLAEDPYGVFAVIITPTRELAFQLSEQFDVFGKTVGVKTAVVVGGIDMAKQGCILAQKPHIVIATPGRLADHMRSTHVLFLRKIRFLVCSGV